MNANAVAIKEMISDRIIRLCKDVERLACELDLLTARGHSRTVYAVLMRMRLAAMTAELVTADLVERLQSVEIWTYKLPLFDDDVRPDAFQQPILVQHAVAGLDQRDQKIESARADFARNPVDAQAPSRSIDFGEIESIASAASPGNTPVARSRPAARAQSQAGPDPARR